MRLSLDLGLGSVATLNAGGGYVFADADAEAYVARLSGLNNRQKEATDDLVVGLKSAGLWSIIDYMPIHAFGYLSAANGLKCIKGAAGDFTSAGAVSWSPRGVVGDGSTGYLIGPNPTTFAGNATRDSISFWQFGYEPATPSNKYTLGTNNSSVGPRLRPAQVTSAVYSPGGYLGNGSAFTGDVAYRKAKPTPILFGINRTGNAVCTLWECDQKVETSVVVASALTNQAIWVLRNSTTYSAESVAFTCMAGGMTDQQVADFWALVRDFLVAAFRPIVMYGDSLTADASGWDSPAAGAIRSPRWTDDMQADLLRPVANQGISGQTSSDIRTRFEADKFAIYATAGLWMGRNDPNNAISEATSLANIAACVSAMESSTYFLLNVPNGHYPEEALGEADYTAILSLNAALATAHGSRLLHIREHLVSLGAPGAAYPDPVYYPTDQIPIQLQETYQLPNTAVHFYDAGASVIRQQVESHIASLAV